MSDNTDVMKGGWSGVQKLIHNECRHIKAGMKTLPIDVHQLFVDVLYFFYTAAKESSNLVTTGVHSFHLSQPLFSNIAPLVG